MQQAPQGPGGPVVYVRVDKKVKTGSFAKETVKNLSIAQISLGAASFLCQILIIIVSTTYSHNFFDNLAGVGEGLYCGVFYVIAGVLGLTASRKPSRCNITAFMILCIIAAVFSFIHTVVSSINLHGIITADRWSWSDNDGSSGRGGNQVLLVAMILSSLAEGTIAVICSALCCRACCCNAAEVYLTQGPGLEEGGSVPVQLGLHPVPVMQTVNQQIGQPPSYGEVVMRA